MASKSGKAARAPRSQGVPRISAAQLRRVARPDAIDFRDRPFVPMVSLTPQLERLPDVVLPIKHQGQTNACTGFALALVVEYLQRKSLREKDASVSPFMLYSMARRYDEFPGAQEDEGSSARGALKGWFKHGACRERLYPTIDMPPASDTLADDWWFDAVKRPLGAYYRVDPKRIADMHAALNEVGILLATCGCHSGWDDGLELEPQRRVPKSYKSIWRIPRRGGRAQHPGHAFAIVGYCEDGFLIQNSWGPDWGSHGWAVLGYDDWVDNAMDCWVAQLGVVTAEHRAIARSMTLRTDASTGLVKLAASEVLREREIAPFVINMSNNGELSNSGSFRTMPDDVRAIVDVQLPLAREKFDLKPAEPIDVCVYAHGGLVGEKAAAQIAARWIPRLYDAKIFPIFLMWETGAFDTIMNRLSDAVKDVPRTAGGIGEQIERWWNRRLERALARPGTQLWGEMKQNADAMSKPLFDPRGPLLPQDRQPGAVQLWMHFRERAAQHKLRVHLVGHSAGSIVASFVIDRVADAMPIESLALMAPAVRMQTFRDLVVPRLQSGAVKRFVQFHLSDRAEQDDPTCGPYRRSLLYLVSESFEGGATTPILGLQKDFDRHIAPLLPKVEVHVAPGPVSTSTTHGGFDDDPGTIERIVEFIKGR